MPRDRERADALERTLTSLLELVVIDLSQDDDPHLIFETLNARGTALLQSDLIKNMVIYEAGRPGMPGSTAAEDDLWRFSTDWWRAEIRQGRLTRPRVDVFLNYWLVMRSGQEVASDRVFPAFREYYSRIARSNGPENAVDQITSDMQNVSSAYRELDPDSPRQGMQSFIYRWNVIQAGTLTPVLLWLLASDVPEPQLRMGVDALESYLVRRMFCRMTTSDYNRLFLALVGELEAQDESQAGCVIVEYLRRQSAYSRQWPDDAAFRDSFLSSPIYRLLTRGRLRLVLEGIEERLRTNKAETQDAPRNLTIEHILPRGWRRHWPLPADVDDTTAAEIDRYRLLHTIGNLTLVNDRLNPTLSNHPWERKQKTLGEHSVLFLNKDLLADAPDVWDETAIANRGCQLFEIAAAVWPHGDEF